MFSEKFLSKLMFGGNKREKYYYKFKNDKEKECLVNYLEENDYTQDDITNDNGTCIIVHDHGKKYVFHSEIFAKAFYEELFEEDVSKTITYDGKKEQSMLEKKTIDSNSGINVNIEKVEKWFIDRGLDKADPTKQMLKLYEEMGEVSAGLARNDIDEIKDGIGDVLVVLIGLSMQLGISVEECLNIAYNEIKDRKGKLINGVFIKEEDLQKEI